MVTTIQYIKLHIFKEAQIECIDIVVGDLSDDLKNKVKEKIPDDPTTCRIVKGVNRPYSKIQPFENAKIYKEMYDHPDPDTVRQSVRMAIHFSGKFWSF